MGNKIDGRFAKSVGNFKNRIINGDMRVNQREFDGSTFVDGDYCWDRWKATASAMTQIIEEGEFKPFTVYTLSGTGVTTQQITSPASGHWTLPDIPRTATNIQLEEGSVATEFEQRPISIEQMLCERYYEEMVSLNYTEPISRPLLLRSGNTAATGYSDVTFKTQKRVTPTVTELTTSEGVPGIWITTGTFGFTIVAAGLAGVAYVSGWKADAEL